MEIDLFSPLTKHFLNEKCKINDINWEYFKYMNNFFISYHIKIKKNKLCIFKNKYDIKPFYEFKIEKNQGYNHNNCPIFTLYKSDIEHNQNKIANLKSFLPHFLSSYIIFKQGGKYFQCFEYIESEFIEDFLKRQKEKDLNDICDMILIQILNAMNVCYKETGLSGLMTNFRIIEMDEEIFIPIYYSEEEWFVHKYLKTKYLVIFNDYININDKEDLREKDIRKIPEILTFSKRKYQEIIKKIYSGLKNWSYHHMLAYITNENKYYFSKKNLKCIYTTSEDMKKFIKLCNFQYTEHYIEKYIEYINKFYEKITIVKNVESLIKKLNFEKINDEIIIKYNDYQNIMNIINDYYNNLNYIKFFTKKLIFLFQKLSTKIYFKENLHDKGKIIYHLNINDIDKLIHIISKLNQWYYILKNDFSDNNIKMIFSLLNCSSEFFSEQDKFDTSEMHTDDFSFSENEFPKNVQVSDLKCLKLKLSDYNGESIINKKLYQFYKTYDSNFNELDLIKQKITSIIDE